MLDSNVHIFLRRVTIVDLPILQHWDKQPHVIESDLDGNYDWETELQHEPTWGQQLMAELDGCPIGFVQIIDPALEETHYWGVDNMWTHAPIEDLMPYLKEIANTLPPAPSHMLWLNWHPSNIKTDMAYSNEDNIYIALYANWKNAADTAKYGDWAANMMDKMSL